MSIALVVIRLELLDSSEAPDLFYCAPTFVMAQKPSKLELEKYSNTEELRGCRQIAELGIETLTFKDNPEGEGIYDGTFEQVKSQARPEQCERSEPNTYAKVVSGTCRSVRSSVDDMESRNMDQCESSCEDPTRTRPRSSNSKMLSTIEFVCGNPTVERVQGLIHLFKDSKKTTLAEEGQRSEMVCMLAVPSSFNTRDLLQFTNHVYEGIKYMKIIKDLSPNNYMVLIKFKDQKLADQFYSNYNNKPFNSIESDICHLVYVAHVDFLNSSEGGALPVPGLVELPHCPVCLERMDESVDGILTILCNHTFHGDCLSKWGDSSCPVCRYCQTPEPSGDNYCFDCNSTESLWICLICGQVGCGRYVDGHAYEHFARTNHTYAMQLSNGRVWDYVGDNYVHRLIQNKEDGKLVEMDEHGLRVTDEKIDSLQLEYTFLLTNQLESQRRYFEEKMAAHEMENAERLTKCEQRAAEAVGLKLSMEKELSTLRGEKGAAEKKCAKLSSQLTRALHDLQEERALNQSLTSNQQDWQKRIKDLEGETESLSMELQEAKDQLRDVLFHLDAHNKLSENMDIDREELEEGKIVVGDAVQKRRKQNKRK